LNERGEAVGVMHGPGRDGQVSAVYWNGRAASVLPDLGGVQSGAEAINERGQIVGWSGTPAGGESHAVLWEDGKAHDLGPGSAVAITDGGVVIGTRSSLSFDSEQGFLWSNGTRVELDFWPLAVNEQRHVVGFRAADRWSPKANVPQAWPWDYAAIPVSWKNDEVVELPGLTDPSLGIAKAINESGRSAGVVMLEDGAQHLIIWDGNDTQDLGAVAPKPEEDWLSVLASGPYLNERGDVAVSTLEEGGYIHPGPGAFFASDGELIRLPSQIHTVHGINDDSLVIGEGPAGASIWAHGRLYSLPGGRDATPRAINKRGHVIGSEEARPILWKMLAPPSG
jgi:probable HAF family extracellular repeat protein